MAIDARIGSLHVHLGLDSAQFQSGMKQAQSGAAGLSRSLVPIFAAVAVAATAAVAAISTAVKGSIDHMDELGKSAQKIGLSVEALSRLEYAARLSDVSLGGLTNGLKKLSQNMVAVADGGGAAAKAGFDALNVSVANSDGTLRSSTDVMGDVADAFAAMPDGVQKTAAAVAIFGKAGADLIPMLNQGRAGLQAAADESDRFGQTISTSAALAADELNDNLEKMGLQASGFANRIASAVLPALAALSGWLLDLSGAFDQLVPYIAVAGAALAGFVAPAVIAGVAHLTVAIGVGMVGAVRALAVAMMANPLGLLIAGIAAAIAAAFAFRDWIKDIFGVDVVQIAADVANFIAGAFVGAFEGIKATWSLLPAALGDVAIQAAQGVIRSLQYMLQNAVSELNVFLRGVNNALTKVGLRDNFIPYLDNSLVLEDLVTLENQFAGAGQQVADAFGTAFQDALSRDYLGEMGTAIGDALNPDGSTDTDLADMTAGINGVGDALDDASTSASGLGSALDDIMGSVKSTLSSVASGIIKAFFSAEDAAAAAFEAIKGGLDSLADKTMDMVTNGIFDAILGAIGGGVSGAGLPGLSGGGMGGGGIPGLATGGRTMTAGLVEVGERGRELINLPAGAEVIRSSDVGVADSRNTHITFGVAADAGGNLIPFIQQILHDGIETYRHTQLQSDVHATMGDPMARGNL